MKLVSQFGDPLPPSRLFYNVILFINRGLETDPDLLDRMEKLIDNPNAKDMVKKRKVIFEFVLSKAFGGEATISRTNSRTEGITITFN
jgi:hypothetical protein